MPPVLQNNEELSLKKRARRRLVGAIALVFLMVIILPRILQDRVALAPQEVIKISMPAVVVIKTAKAIEDNLMPVEAAIKSEPQPQIDLAASEEVVMPDASVATKLPVIADKHQVDDSKKTNVAKNEQETKKLPEKSTDANRTEAKASEPKVVEAKSVEVKAVEIKSLQKNEGNFTIQVGVFSDMTNVKQLQTKLKQAGLNSRTERITTPKGEKIRLRAGSFSSRQDAAYGLTKMQAVDLTGMVISND